MKKEVAKVGRPTDYNFDLAVEICLAIATTPVGLEKLIEKNPHWPTFQVIYKWLLLHDEFNEMYRKARINQTDPLFDELLKIADDSSQDQVENKHGDLVCNSEYIARSRLKIDTRKWMMAKLKPRVYGESIQQDTTVTVKHEDALKVLE